MFKILYLIVAATWLYADGAVAIEYNTTIDIRQRCDTCKGLMSLKNINLDEIETYDGFEDFSIKYDSVQQYGVEDPELICLLTDMCPFSDEEEDEPQSELSLFDELYTANDLMVQRGSNEVIFKLKLKNPVCSACKKVFKWVLDKIMHLADKRPNKGTVRGFFSKGCRYVPRLIRNSCTVLIKKKSGKLAKMALEHYAPKLACKTAKACF